MVVPEPCLVKDAVPVPVVASGGVGNLQHLADGVTLGGASAVLAASIFHYNQFSIAQVKAFLKENPEIKRKYKSSRIAIK